MEMAEARTGQERRGDRLHDAAERLGLACQLTAACNELAELARACLDRAPRRPPWMRHARQDAAAHRALQARLLALGYLETWADRLEVGARLEAFMADG